MEHDRNSNVKPGCANQVNRSSPCFLQVLFETHAYLLDRDDNKCQRLYITIAPHYTDGASFYRRNLRSSGMPAWYSWKIMFLEMLVATFPDINHRPLHICPQNTAKNFLTLIIPTLLTFVQSQISSYASTNIECKFYLKFTPDTRGYEYLRLDLHDYYDFVRSNYQRNKYHTSY